MTNKQAAHLRPGGRIRRKGADVDGTIYVVERIEPLPAANGFDIRVHAGGKAFMAWEIDRCEPFRGWPAPKSAA